MRNLGFGRNDKKVRNGGDLEFYKGERGRKDIISLAWFFYNEDGEIELGEDPVLFTPRFTAADIHYIKGMGYILDNEYLRAKLGPPKTKIGTFVVHYHASRKGEIHKPVEFTVKPWQFGEDKYRKLAEIHELNNLTMHDLRVTCEDDNFQKLDFNAIPGGSLWLRSEEWKQSVLEQVKDMEERLRLGREVSIDDLKDHYGDEVSPVPDASSGVDYSDLMDGIE